MALKNKLIFFSFVDFREIWLLVKTTHIARLDTKAAIAIITLRTAVVRGEEGYCLNFEFSNSLHLLEDQRGEDGHGARVTYKAHTRALLSLLFVDIQYSAVCKQD